MSQVNNQALLDNDPEVKSFIYQQISEFHPFVTPETIVAVIARDPRKATSDSQSFNSEIPRSKLKNMFRIAIILREGSTEIQDEALSESVFGAITEAKNKLIKRLSSIQNEALSESERMQQINLAIQNAQVH